MTASWALALLLWLPQEKTIDSCALALWAAGPGPKPEILDVEVAALEERATHAARRLYHGLGYEIWLRPLKSEEYLVSLVSRSSRPVSPDVIWNDLGILKERGDSPRVRDVLRRDNLGKVHGGFAQRLEPGQCALFHVKP